MDTWRTVALATLAAMVAACNPSTAEPPSDTVASATSTTRTPRITDDSGRPPVTFDPCFDIPDDIMNAAGYDADNKELADMPMGHYTFLGCTYHKEDRIPGVRRGYHLTILSGNVTLEEELAKNGHVATETSINGRRALLEMDPNNKDTCIYVLQANFGMVGFLRMYNKDHPGLVPESEWCANMEDVVSTIEPSITE